MALTPSQRDELQALYERGTSLISCYGMTDEAFAACREFHIRCSEVKAETGIDFREKFGKAV